MSFTVGLTGGIGSGKTLISNRLSEHGVPIIDTDIIAREIVMPGEPTLKRLAERFGEEVLLSDGQLNRSKLRQIAFSSPTTKQALDEITHPAIRSATANQIAAVNHAYCVVVIPLLTKESKFGQFLQRILAVNCETEIRIKRVMQRNNLSRKEVFAILNTQISDAEREDFADDIINNNRSKEHALHHTDELHKTYLAMSRLQSKSDGLKPDTV